MTAREREQRDRADQGRERSTAAPEDRDPRLVDDRERERAEDAGLVQQHAARVRPGQPRDEREEELPERERVAGMEPAVLELVHRPQVQVAEREQLANAGEVEERVAVERARDLPDQHAGEDAEADHAQRPAARDDDAAREQCDERPRTERRVQPDREVDRTPDREHDRAGREDPGQRPGKRRGYARPSDEPRAINAPGRSTTTVAAASFR